MAGTPPYGGLIAGNTPPGTAPRGTAYGALPATQGMPSTVDIWSMPVKMRQQYLNKAGYNVTVDGKPGAQTLTAGKAFEKGIPASYWNRIWAKNHPAPVLGTGITRSKSNAGAPPPPPGPNNPGNTIPDAPYAPAPTQNVPGLGRVSLIDPSSYASAAMASKYGSPQAELARQLAQAGADQSGHQTDIQNWFAKILSDQKAGGAANVAALGGILSGADKANLGLVNAIGGSANTASAGVASLGQQGRNALEQLAANQANFDDTQHTAIAQQGVDTANEEYKRGEATKTDLRKQLSDLAAQRGADYTATLSNAQQDRFKQQLAIHDARVSDAMLPGQLHGQTLDNAGKQSSIDLNNAKIAAFNQQTSGTQDWTKPQTQNDWNDAVRSTVADKNGALVTDPQQAWIQIQHAMARNGISGNDTAVSVAKQALQDALSRSHARGLYKNWTWGPKGLVKLPPKKKK